MKTEILEKLKDALNVENLDEAINGEKFYFQKAVDKYNEFVDLPKIGEEKTKILIKKVNQQRGSNSFNHMD